MAALQGTGWVATYAATKAFEMILAESLWWELKSDGVDVTAVLPGATDTEGLRRNSPYIEDPAALARPRDVALEALDRLGKTPSFICGEQNRALAEAMRGLTREQAIDMMSSGTRLMAEGVSREPVSGERGEPASRGRAARRSGESGPTDSTDREPASGSPADAEASTSRPSRTAKE
jgi:NAD(P)-dependent dehydrogenase (short-subunit alcohol dehydrogenase family)